MKFLTFGLVALALSCLSCSKKSSVTGPSDTTPNAATIDVNTPQQIIRGFGGVNMPGWIPDLTTDQVNTAFGIGPGQLGLSILRVRVPYDSTQFMLEVSTARQAKSLGAIIIASPWTPPPGLKTNNNIVGGELADSSYAAYAAHLRSFADYLAQYSASLYAISLQNEPDASVSYESCSWSAAQMVKFLKVNAPFIGVRIIAPESMNFNRSLSDPILNDAAASANLAIIGGHIYGGGLTSYPLAASRGKEVWMTEHLVLDTTWRYPLFTATEINDCMNAGMNAYIWWYIRRYYGPMDESGALTKRGYVISQFSRFIRPGFVKINSTANPQSHVFVTAYKSSARIVIVAINAAAPGVRQTFDLPNGSVSSFLPYVTSETKNCEQGAPVAVSSGTFSDSLEASSVTTYVSN